MIVRFAIFANSAILTSDGLFSVLGGGIQWITAKQLPATSRNLCLLIGFEIGPDECDQSHPCSVRVIDPGGNSLSPDLSVTVKTARSRVNPTRPVTFTAHFSYDGFTFTKTGEYRFCVMVADEIVTEAVLDVGLESQS